MKNKINEKFIDKFNDKDKSLINNYFKDLNKKIFLSNVDRITFCDDFEKAIIYYTNHGKTVEETLKLLSLDNLGDYYKDPVNNWYPLDNAAKIYPLSMKESWMSVYRVSYYLKEDIVPEIFQIALTFTIKRFPTFRTSIRKGFFWNYMDGIKNRFHVYKDSLIPCKYINVSNFGKQAFKAVYYKNRISIECFHVLTDGYGAITFLSTLTSEYLRLLGKPISFNDFVYDINKKPSDLEVINEFNQHDLSGPKKSLRDSIALDLDGKLSNVKPSQIIHFEMNLNDLKKLAHKKNSTITELMLAFLFIACSYSTSKDGYIKIEVPVNMRKYYNTKTLRNFSLYVMISIKKSEIKDIDSLLLEIKNQMKEKINKESLNQTMAYTNGLVKALKFIPLFIKRPIARIVYGYLGEKVLTTVFSNLGNINLPDDMKKEVVKADFVLGTNMTRKALFSMVTVNDVATLSISKFTLNSSLENAIFNLIKDNNIGVDVYGSDIYEYKK